MKNTKTIGGLTILELGSKISSHEGSSCIIYCKDSNGFNSILNCEISHHGIGFFVSDYDACKMGQPNVKSADWKRNFYKVINRDNFKEIIMNKKDYNIISNFLGCGTIENTECIHCLQKNIADWYYYKGFRCKECIEKIKNSDNWKY